MDVSARPTRGASGRGARASTDMCPSVRLRAGVIVSLAVLMMPRGSGDVAAAAAAPLGVGTDNVDSASGGRDEEGSGGGADGLVELSIEVDDAEAILSGQWLGSILLRLPATFCCFLLLLVCPAGV